MDDGVGIFPGEAGEYLIKEGEGVLGRCLWKPLRQLSIGQVDGIISSFSSSKPKQWLRQHLPCMRRMR
jgi:hypothetical protein